MAVGLVVPDVAAAFYAAALKGAQEVARGGRLPRARGEHRARAPSASARRCGRCARTASTASSSPPPAATRTSACRRCSSTTCRQVAGVGAVALDNAGGRRAARRAPGRRPRPPPDRVPRGARHGRGRAPRRRSARAASGSRASAPPWAARASRCRRSTCARATRCAPEQRRAPVAAELLALRAAADRRHRREPTRWRSACWPRRATRACGCPRTSRSCRFDEPAYADLLDPPVTSLDRHDRELGRRAARLLLDALGGARRRSRRRRARAAGAPGRAARADAGLTDGCRLKTFSRSCESIPCHWH